MGVQEPLMEAGLDSLGVVDLKNAIVSRLGTSLPATATFDYPTIAALAQYISDQQPSQTVATPDLSGLTRTVKELVTSVLGVAVDDDTQLMEVSIVAYCLDVCMCVCELFRLGHMAFLIVACMFFVPQSSYVFWILDIIHGHAYKG